MNKTQKIRLYILRLTCYHKNCIHFADITNTHPHYFFKHITIFEIQMETHRLLLLPIHSLNADLLSEHISF